MSDILATWTLARGRFVDIVKDLSTAQLNWKLYPGAASIGQMAVHVAGVEVSFGYQLKQEIPVDGDARLRLASTNGIVNDHPFPYSDEELTSEFVAFALARGKEIIEPILSELDAYRDVQIVSALGPVIDGSGAFARLAQHPAYHQGQAYQIRMSPDFPKD